LIKSNNPHLAGGEITGKNQKKTDKQRKKRKKKRTNGKKKQKKTGKIGKKYQKSVGVLFYGGVIDFSRGWAYLIAGCSLLIAPGH
jgi:hypothetical protein